MRRKDRQVEDIREIESVLKKCDVCRLGMRDGDDIYVLPLNFGFRLSDSELTLYFHSAREGRKIDIIRQKPLVGFEMDCGHQLIEAEKACEYAFRFESVVGSGRASLVEDVGEKKLALGAIMAQVSSRDFDITDAMASSVAIIKVVSGNFSCKRHE